MLLITFIFTLSLYIFPTQNNEEIIVPTDLLRPINTMEFSYDAEFHTEKSTSFVLDRNVRK